jgi:hypothetical protein
LGSGGLVEGNPEKNPLGLNRNHLQGGHLLTTPAAAEPAAGARLGRWTGGYRLGVGNESIEIFAVGTVAFRRQRKPCPPLGGLLLDVI